MQKSRKILLLTVGPRERASARYRALQYIPTLNHIGYITSVITPITKPSASIKRLLSRRTEENNILSAAKTSDIVFIQKRLFRVNFIKKLLTSGILLIFDFDDIIHTTHDDHWSALTKKRIEKRFQSICSLSNLVIAGNYYLSEIAKQHSDNVIIIPTVVEFKRYSEKKHYKKDNIVLGWIGQPNNYNLIEEIFPVLHKISMKHKEVKLLIISKGNIHTNSIHIEQIEWQEDKETDDLLKIDIGIMPMTDNEWSKGKCALKAIQYMASGIPTVCSDVGENRNVVRNGIDGFLVKSEHDWITALETLITSEATRNRMGKSGRKRIQEHYSLEKTAPILASWINQ